MERRYGDLSPWPSAPQLTSKAEIDPSLPDHWPLWARLKVNDQELSQPTTDDVEFLIHGFHEVHPRLDEEDRYQRFCLTFDGYWWSKQMYPGADSPASVLAATSQRVRMIAGSTAYKESMADDDKTRLVRFCSLSEIRASMFFFQRAYRHQGVDLDSSLLSTYPLLRVMAYAILEKLRSGRIEFWDE